MTTDTLTKILDLARWAPSGDNAQPWRFEIVDGQTVRVHGFDTRDHVLYDFDGHASHIAHGALLETMRIAATSLALSASWFIINPGNDRNPVYEVSFSEDLTITRDPLQECIERRTVQRRPMKTTPLTSTQRQALVTAVGQDYQIQFFESHIMRWTIARLLWNSAKIRLTCPEAYLVHKEIIEWRARFSEDRIPEKAVGVSPVTARMMEWVLKSWGRVHFFNRFLMGTIAPRVELDLLPGFFCAAHLLVRPSKSPECLADWVRLGGAWQRIWLTATFQGLHLQPQMTPIIFRWYARAGRTFSADATLMREALKLSDDLERLATATPDDCIGFFARVGTSDEPSSRSLRLDMSMLMK